MKKIFLTTAILLLCAIVLFAAVPPKVQPLPAQVSNNAVTWVKTRGSLLVFSLMGMGPKKTWDAITNSVYSADVDVWKWAAARPVPGPVGRIAAVAVGAREHVFLFGGYVPDADGSEITVPDLNVYEPLTDRWLRGDDIPVPVDDSIAGVRNDRYIYLVSGWSKSDAVPNVQVYDAEKNHWFQATPIPGTPVFGHAGALVGDTIIYVDGARKNVSEGAKYIASDECWMGKIDHKDPAKIVWSKLPAHPGNARYRIAAGGSEKDEKVYFTGGTDNPYNYNGIGYDGKASEPSPVTFAFNLKTDKWETVSDKNPYPTMDHRGLIALPQGLVVIGGMDKSQTVTSTVSILPRK
jgi:N-acetylneuraminic acid mutarotase